MKCRLRHFVTAHVPTRSPLMGQPLGDDTGFNSPPAQQRNFVKKKDTAKAVSFFLVEVIPPQRYHSPIKMTVLGRTAAAHGMTKKYKKQSGEHEVPGVLPFHDCVLSIISSFVSVKQNRPSDVTQGLSELHSLSPARLQKMQMLQKWMVPTTGTIHLHIILCCCY